MRKVYVRGQFGPQDGPSRPRPASEGKGVQNMAQQYLLASDFDQTLSFNDSGVVLAELIGITNFHDRVKGLSQINLVQQGAELSYLILHDPEFRRVRQAQLVETGKRIRLKHNVQQFAKALENLADGYNFSFYVISAAPQEIIQSALEGIVPPENIFGTRFHYAETGDGSSDLRVMMHVNSYDGLTIAVSEAEFITRVAKRTVLSDNAMSVLVPVMEDVLRMDSSKIRRYFATQGLMLREWGKMRTDHLTIEESPEVQSAPDPTGDAATESARLQAPAVTG